MGDITQEAKSIVDAVEKRTATVSKTAFDEAYLLLNEQYAARVHSGSDPRRLASAIDQELSKRQLVPEVRISDNASLRNPTLAEAMSIEALKANKTKDGGAMLTPDGVNDGIDQAQIRRLASNVQGESHLTSRLLMHAADERVFPVIIQAQEDPESNGWAGCGTHELEAITPGDIDSTLSKMGLAERKEVRVEANESRIKSQVDDDIYALVHAKTEKAKDTLFQRIAQAVGDTDGKLSKEEFQKFENMCLTARADSPHRDILTTANLSTARSVLATWSTPYAKKMQEADGTMSLQSIARGTTAGTVDLLLQGYNYERKTK